MDDESWWNIFKECLLCPSIKIISLPCNPDWPLGQCKSHCWPRSVMLVLLWAEGVPGEQEGNGKLSWDLAVLLNPSPISKQSGTARDYSGLLIVVLPMETHRGRDPMGQVDPLGMLQHYLQEGEKYIMNTTLLTVWNLLNAFGVVVSIGIPQLLTISATSVTSWFGLPKKV